MNRTTTLIICCLVLALIFYLLSPVLTPFLAAILLAYCINPLVRRLEKLKFPRLLAITTVFSLGVILIFVLIIIIIPLIERQVTNLVEIIPKAIEWLEINIIPKILSMFDIEQVSILNRIKSDLASQITAKGGIGELTLKALVQSGSMVFAIIVDLILIPVVTFYLLYDWQSFLKTILNLVPRRWQKTTKRVAKESDLILAEFLRGQLIVMGLLGLYYGIALTLMGLKVGIGVGFVIGIASIIPYLGVIIGFILAVVTSLAQFGDFSILIPIVLIFMIGQFVESFFLTPKLVGQRVGLHPVVAIFAIMCGGWLFGFFGVLLAVPAAAVLLGIMRYGINYYRNTNFYKA